MRTGLLLGFLFMMLVPVAQAQLLLGTEDLPEIPDVAGDVQYDPAYVGSKDHGYIDFVAGWFGYDNSTDEILVTIKTADGTAFESAPKDWDIGCGISGNVTANDGEVRGRLLVDWHRYVDGSPMRGRVLFFPAGEEGIGESDSRPVDSRFEAQLDEPAYFEFGIARSNLLLLGDEIQEMTALCMEYASTPPPFILQLWRNMDPAASEAIYSFQDHQRVQAADGAVDPIEKLPPSSQNPPVTSDEQTSTPSITVGAVLLGLIVSAIAHRRRP